MLVAWVIRPAERKERRKMVCRKNAMQRDLICNVHHIFLASLVDWHVYQLRQLRISDSSSKRDSYRDSLCPFPRWHSFEVRGDNIVSTTISPDICCQGREMARNLNLKRTDVPRRFFSPELCQLSRDRYSCAACQSEVL